MILAASTDYGTTGDDLIEQIRYGIGAVADNGFNANLVVVSPSQLVTLDLSRSTTEKLFLLSPRRPINRHRVRCEASRSSRARASGIRS
jgi:hypothetical protein